MASSPQPGHAQKELRPLKGWSAEAALWLTATTADAEAHEETYRQAALLPTNLYLLAQARALGTTGSAAGLRALREGKVLLSRDGRHGVQLEGFDWSHPALHDRSHLWVVQQWLPVRDCLLERNQGGATTGLHNMVPWVRAWIETNITVESLRHHQSLTWHDHATALRAIYAVYFLLALADAGVALREAFPRLYEFVGVHLVVLRSEAFYSKRTNHGFDQALALYLLATVFDLGDLSRECRATGRQRLLEEMAVAFSQEGVHIENSPSYHPLMLNRLLQAGDMLRGFGDTEIGIDIEGSYARGIEFLTHAIRPDGRLPAFGDSDDAPQRFEPREALVPTLAPPLRYSQTAGREGSPPAHSVRIFPRSGYAFMRNRWTGDFDAMLHLAVKSGFLSPYHRHDDDNNIVLFAYGEEWLIESGIYKYAERDQTRAYLRSSLAHNIVTPLGVPVSRSVPPPGSGNGFRAWRTVEGVTELRMRSLMYEGMVYDRELFFDRRAETIELRDRIVDSEKQPRDFECRLHFPLDKILSIDADGNLRARSSQTGRCLVVAMAGPGFDKVEIVTARKEAPMAGWTSPGLGRLSEAQTVIFHQLARPAYESRMTIAFDKG